MGEPEPTSAFATSASAPTGQMPFGLPNRQRFLTMSLMRFDEHHTHDPGVVPLCFFGDPGLDLLLPLEGERLRAPEPPTAAAGFLSSG